MLIRADSGTEKFIPWAKSKLAQWKAEMVREGRHSFQRVVFVDDNTTRIYINSMALGNGRFRDSIRITGGVISGRFVWGNTHAPAGDGDKWVFRADLNGTVSEEVFIDDPDVTYVDWSKDRSTAVAINETLDTATIYRGGATFLVEGTGTFRRLSGGEFSGTIGTDPYYPTTPPATSWYQRFHVSMSSDGKTIYLCSADDTNLLVTAVWNDETVEYDVSRVAIPPDVQSFMDGASGVTWETPWFTGTAPANSNSVYSARPTNFNYTSTAGPPGAHDVITRTPFPRFFPNPYRAEVWVIIRLAYVDQETVEHSTGTPLATIRRFDGQELHQVWRYDSDGWVLAGGFGTTPFVRTLVDDIVAGAPLDAPFEVHMIEGLTRDFVLFDPGTREGAHYRWALTDVTYQTVTLSHLQPSSGAMILYPTVTNSPVGSFRSSTTIYKDDDEWWPELPCSVTTGGAGAVYILSLGEEGRALVKSVSAGGVSPFRFYWRYLDAENEGVTYADFAVSALSASTDSVPNGAFLSRSGRMLFGNKVYKDGALIYSEDLFPAAFAFDPLVHTSFVNDGHWQYPVAGPPDRPAISKLVYNTETETWAPQVVRYLPYVFAKTSDIVLEPEVPAPEFTGVDLALEVAVFFGLGDTADLASYSGVAQGTWESAAQGYLDGSKSALLALMYNVFVLQYIEYLGGGVTIDDVVDDYYGEPGHTEAELIAEIFMEQESDVDSIVAGVPTGTPAVYAAVDIETYDSFWLEEFVP